MMMVPDSVAGHRTIAFDGYRPGVLAGVVALHMDYYAAAWNFGLPFETKVAGEMAEFLCRMDARRDLFLTAWSGDDLAGCITIDGSGGGARGAHLRWFIVSAASRGAGLGRTLVEKAIAHCTANCPGPVWLTTFAGLDPARRLYERHGFRMVGESGRDQWNGGVREQLFLRPAEP